MIDASHLAILQDIGQQTILQKGDFFIREVYSLYHIPMELLKAEVKHEDGCVICEVYVKFTPTDAFFYFTEVYFNPVGYGNIVMQWRNKDFGS